jgi:hypothetical protein
MGAVQIYIWVPTKPHHFGEDSTVFKAYQLDRFNAGVNARALWCFNHSRAGTRFCRCAASVTYTLLPWQPTWTSRTTRIANSTGRVWSNFFRERYVAVFCRCQANKVSAMCKQMQVCQLLWLGDNAIRSSRNILNWAKLSTAVYEWNLALIEFSQCLRSTTENHLSISSKNLQAVPMCHRIPHCENHVRNSIDMSTFSCVNSESDHITDKLVI